MSWSKLPTTSSGVVDNSHLTPEVNRVESKIQGTENRINEEVNPKIAAISSDLSKANRETVVLSQGTSVVQAGVNTLADVEIEGRTLTSLANSNLESLKYYALADAKTRIKVDGQVVSGVGKFQKKDTLKTVSDFKGKVAGSTVENPHILKRWSTLALVSPDTSPSGEVSNAQYSLSNSLDSQTFAQVTLVAPGYYAQHQFSFNVIAQIEKELGLVPGNTTLEKVQWVRSNVSRLGGEWYGFGLGPSGNKATLRVWKFNTSEWLLSPSHTNSYSSKIALQFTGVNDPNILIDDHGFMHFLANAEPSDGTTFSSISTDYTRLDIELKPTARLNTRGSIIRVENFEGKVSGSVVENPHKYLLRSSSTIPTPESFNFESQVHIDRILKEDNQVSTGTTLIEGSSPFHLMSFNIIEAIERNIGKIPFSSLEDKVTWVRNNVSTISGVWRGAGSSVGGPKANFSFWSGGTWFPAKSHSLSSVSALSWGFTVVSNQRVDAQGFSHFLAYADPSDGVISSSINTDYVELQIELKPTADFHAPKVPLYEVTKAEYDKIGVDWDSSEVLRRYPVVEGTQHLMNPYIVAEGENLLPPFTEWNLHTNARIIRPYEVELNPTANSQITDIYKSVLPNSNYCISFEGSGYIWVQTQTKEGIGVSIKVLDKSEGVYSFLTESTAERIRIVVYNWNKTTSQVTFKNPMLTLGSTAKPFVPRNPSYLYSQATLAAIGDKKDRLFKHDGKWKKLKVVESIVLDGSLEWTRSSNGISSSRYLTLQTSALSLPEKINHSQIVQKHDGVSIAKQQLTFSDSLIDSSWSHGTVLIGLIVGNLDSGWGDSYLPPLTDIKRYFNGWKYTNGTTWHSVTGNGQTATAQQALDTKPTDYTPYKLSYVLATPIVEDVEVEGEIKVNGLTQVMVDSGIISRELVIPENVSSQYTINAKSRPSSHLKYVPDKFLGLFVNGKMISNLSVRSNAFSNGGFHIDLPLTEYNPDTDVCHITYSTLDKYKLTNAPTSLRLTYVNNVRSSLEDLVGATENYSTAISVNSRLLIDILARLKAQGL